jgi:hypothetical protein
MVSLWDGCVKESDLPTEPDIPVQDKLKESINK